MDLDKSLQRLKEAADRTTLRDIRFSRDMEQGVWQRIYSKKRPASMGKTGAWTVTAMTTATVALLILLLPAILPTRTENSGKRGNESAPHSLLFPRVVWEVPSLWKASEEQKGLVDGQTFQYYGEKPVRLITSELYEGQGQKVLWLLNGSFAKQVEVVGISETGEKVNLGVYEVGGKLYDADGSFPSTIVLPKPGIWKLQVLSDGGHFGSLFMKVHDGIMPANRVLVEPLIIQYVESNPQLVPNANEWKVSIDLLGVESRSAEQKTAYAWVKILNQNPLSSAGISAPMVFEIRFDGNRYKVASHKMAQPDGEKGTGIQDIFPPQYVEKIKRYTQP